MIPTQPISPVQAQKPTPARTLTPAPGSFTPRATDNIQDLRTAGDWLEAAKSGNVHWTTVLAFEDQIPASQQIEPFEILQEAVLASGDAPTF